MGAFLQMISFDKILKLEIIIKNNYNVRYCVKQ